MFVTTLPVNIEHINYGGHLAHDKLVTIMHEARLQFFDQLGQSEIDFYGISLILKSLNVNYQKEVFRGEKLTFTISVSDVRGSAFSLNYEVRNEATDIIADAIFVLVGFNYDKRRIARLPELCRQTLMADNIAKSD